MPIEIGRRTLRWITALLIVGVVLLITSLVTEVALDNPAVDDGLEIVGVATVLLSVAFVAAPGIAFLIHGIRYRDQGATRRLSYSATASAIPPGLLGFMLIPVGTSERIVGWILLAIAVAVVVRAWTLRRAEATADAAVLGYEYSVAGLVLVLLAATSTGHGHSRSRSYITAMKSDLRNLVSAQEDYFAAHKRYTTDLVALQFKPSNGVTAPLVVVGKDWWQATNTHSQLSNTTCGIAINTTNPVVVTVLEGEPVCK